MAASIAALLQAAERFSAAVDSDTVLQALAETIFQLVEARSVAVYKPEGPDLVRISCLSDVAGTRLPARLPILGSAPGWALTHAAAYRTVDSLEDAASDGLTDCAQRGGALLAVPVMTASGSVAAVACVSRAAGCGRFAAADLRVCEATARHAAIAYERSRLTAELQRTTRALTLLEERARVGMDLHDGAIQSLYGVMLNLAAIGRSLDADPAQTIASLDAAIAQVAGVIEEVRSYISGLWANELGARGLPAGLQSLARDLQTNTQISTTLDLGVDVDAALQPEVLANLLQVAREAVSNVIRHARATGVSIRTEQAGDRLSLSIVDNGVGFLPSAIAGRPDSQGLNNMAERARRIGGELHVTSEPGEGTEIRLDLDLRR
jgi:signal transduction histidine kinase